MEYQTGPWHWAPVDVLFLVSEYNGVHALLLMLFSQKLL